MENLKETLKRLEGKEVSIGTVHGNGFLYIGKAEKVDLIVKIFEDYRDTIKNKKIPAKKKAIYYMKRRNSKRKKIESLVAQAREIAKLVESLENYEEYLSGDVDPMNRNIVEGFESNPAIDEPIRLIVAGRETGEFWFKSEFDLKYGNK